MLAKRILDIGLSLLGLVLLAPLLLLVALLIRWRLGPPVFFVQTRPGLEGKPFLMVKFRTMGDQRDGRGELLADAQRLPPFGRWLRATSLDELPELWNVLKGEMSLVGPRPLLMEYLPLYSQKQFRRHEVPPGITGWAQVNGRNAVDWEERFAMDLWYVDNRSLWLDLQILGLTLLRGFSSHGVSAAGHATMPKFTGTRRDSGDSDG